MQAASFTDSSWTELVRSQDGQDCCVPRDLPPAVEVGGDLLSALSAADRAVGQLAGIARVLPNPRLLVRTFAGREAVLSSRIEGTQASLSDLLLFDVTPTAVESRAPDVREVANYVRALEHGIGRLRAIPLTLNLIRELHAILLEDVRGSDRNPGQFRRVQNWIGPYGVPLARATYVPPPPERLMGALAAMERFINTPAELPLLIRMAMVHYQFEAIHPFEDGNGRVGRLLISLMLDAERAIPFPVLYLSDYFERHQQAYYRHLLAVSQTGAWREWLAFVLRGVAEQAIDAVERSANLMRLRDEWARRCQQARASALLLRLLDALFVNPFVNMRRAADLLEVNPQSAQSNVDKLVEAGILYELTGQKRNRVYVAREVLRTLEETPAFDRAPPNQEGPR